MIPNPKWFAGVSDVLDAAAAVDKGGGQVGLPITGHAFVAGQIVVIAGTVNYNGARAIDSQTANEIVITATYVAETFAGTETVVFGRQVICKEDFRYLEAAILGQPGVRMQPPLVWVSNTTVRVKATADCLAETALTGLPNILNSSVQVSGGLSDGKIRSNASDVSCDLSSGGLYGTTQTEKASQWYAVFAIAADDDTTFTLKAIPIMRVKSQAGQVISLGTLVTPATGIGYGFTTDELIDGKVYFLTGASIGLVRTISANNNDDATGGTITYSGAGLTMSAGDWFIVLPPATNFRLIGTVFNNSSSHIQQFYREGNWVQTVGSISCAVTTPAGIVEDITIACPFATRCSVTMDGSYEIGHPESGFTAGDHTGQSKVAGTSGYGTIEFNLKFCRYRVNTASSLYSNGYGYPPGCGY
jgi:hypothetical protein